MWVDFAIACIACVAFLFTPGYLLLRVMGFRRVPAFAAAPCFSVAFMAIEAIVYCPLGIPCTWMSIALPPFVGALCLFAVRALLSRGLAFGTVPCMAYGKRQFLTLLLYLALGVGVTIYLYLSVIDSPTSFSQEYDNLFHLGLIQRFMLTGQWSSLAASVYVDPLNPASNPAPNVGMYPSAWHAVCAVIAEMFSQSAPFAANVVNTVFMAVVFSSGMYFLMQTLFPHNRRVVVLGAFAAVAFTSFPERFLWWGPLYPNLAANCLIPAVLALFIVMTQRGESRHARTACALGVLFGGVSLALLQPNAVFALVVFLAPYCSWRIFIEARERWPHAPGSTRLQRLVSRPVLCGALFMLLVIAVWLGIYGVFSDSAVLSYTWESQMTFIEGILNVLFVNYCYCPWVPALGLMIAVGVIYSLWKGHNRWLVASYAMMGIMLIITLSTDGTLKHIVGGFWYTDQMRLAALVAMFAMPLAAMGCHASFRFIGVACRHTPLPLDRQMLLEMASCSVFALLLLFAVFSPYDFGNIGEDGMNDTAMGRMRNTNRWTYNKHPMWYYTNEEEQFVREVMEEYPDEQFINNPFDGSCWAYGAEGMNVYYRAFDVYGYNLESAQSQTIRLHLADVATNTEVQDALRSMKARYVILLDAYGEAYDAMYQWMYQLGQWTGLNGIDEDTPGFELVMSKGDMRLYRITCLD